MAQLGVLEVRVQPDLTGFGSQVTKAMSGIGGAMSRLGATVARDLVGIGTSVGIASGAAVAGLATIGIRTAAGLQTAELQFTTLLGSAEEAKTRVQELFQFARDTPFAADEVIKASRTMQIFGGDALAATENLTMVGDAAAGVGASFDEVAFWVSRSYALMQAGRPWGEAALRLQELGVLSGEARTEIEAMADSGASAADQWGVFTDDLGRYAGSMEGLQNSFSGLQEQLKDIVSLGLAEAFRPAFESLSNLMMEMRDASDSEAFAAAMGGLKVIMLPLSSLFDRAADAVSRFGDMSSGQVFAGFEQFGSIVGSVRANVIQFADSLGPLVPILGGIAAGFVATQASAIPLIGILIPGFSGVTGALIGFLAVSEEARTSLANFGEVMLDAAQGGFAAMEGSIETVVDALGSTFAGVLDALTPLLETVVRDLLPAFGNALGDVVPPLGEIVVGLAELVSGGLTPLVPAVSAVIAALSGPLAGALEVVAATIGLLADNANLVVPAIGGIAAAFAAVQVSTFASNLSLALASLGGIGGVVGGAKLAIYGFADAVTQRMSGMASGVSQSLSGLSVGFGGLATALSGLLIGGAVAAAIMYVTDSMADTRAEAQAAEEAVSRFSSRMREVGELAAAEEMVREFAESNKFLSDMLDETGVSIGAVAQSLVESGTAQGAFTDGMESAAEAVKQGKEGYDGFGESASEASRMAGYLMTEGIVPLNQAFGEARTAADEMSTSQDRGAEAARNYSVAIDGLKMEFDNLYGSQLSLEQSELRLADNFARLSEAAGAAGANLDVANAAGRQNREVVASQVQAIWDFTSAQVEAGATTDAASTAALGQRDALIQTAMQFGLTEAQATAYINELGLTPESINTTAQLAEEQAALDAQNYQNQLDTIDRTNPDSDVNVDDNGTIWWIDNAINNATRDRTVNVGLNLTGYAALDALTANIRALSSPQARGLMPNEDEAAVGFAVSPLAATTDTMTVPLRPRTYGRSQVETVADMRQPVTPVIENRVYVGNQQITDIVRQEARMIERDRSMRYVTGIPSGVT